MSEQIGSAKEIAKYLFKLSDTQLVIFGFFVLIICSITVYIASTVSNNISQKKASDARNAIGYLKVLGIFQSILIVFFSFLFVISQTYSPALLKIGNITICLTVSLLTGVCHKKLVEIKGENILEVDFIVIFNLYILILVLCAFCFFGNFIFVGVANWTQMVVNIGAQVGKAAAASAVETVQLNLPQTMNVAMEQIDQHKDTAIQHVKDVADAGVTQVIDSAAKYAFKLPGRLVSGVSNYIFPSTENASP